MIAHHKVEKWDRRFLELCFHVSQWSKDPRTKAGAVLVKNINQEPVLGYNGFPRKLKDKPNRYINRELKHKIALHAERNAIVTAKRDLTGYTMYSSLRPCIFCTCDIIQAGITRLVYPKLMKEDVEKYADYREDWELAAELLEEAGVAVREYQHLSLKGST